MFTDKQRQEIVDLVVQCLHEFLTPKLKDLATKEDLAEFATKEDLKGLATKEDLRYLRDDMNGRFDEMEVAFQNLRGEVQDNRIRIRRLENKVFPKS